jgi:mannose-1-phosphate guanylyltransferase / mannose-6-phosphate isomerase
VSGIHVVPVILCGGSGTRLWPLSRTGFPKQFLCLTGEESLFQQAARRLVNLGGQIAASATPPRNDGFTIHPPLIVTNEEHRFLASEQLREAGIAMGAALLEPAGRNTAPALTLAALAALENASQEVDPVLVVTPADQTVSDTAAFTSTITAAIAQAQAGGIVILGVTPDAPEMGYGYIQVASSLRGEAEAIQGRGLPRSLALPRNDGMGPAPMPVQVLAFTEKPTLETAQRYLSEGSYFWNAGVFILKASTWLNALKTFRPDILQATQNAWQARKVDANSATQFIRPGKAEFEAIPAESIDYAVMEKCPGSAFPIHMVPLNAGWSDLGAWDAVWKVLPKDAQGNAHIGDVLTTDSRNTLVHASHRLVSLVGVEDLIVIETPDAVMVANKTRSQDVKHIVNALNTNGREEPALHRKVHRPWGWYDSIDEGGRFKVKRIQVKPGAAISLQKHHHRAEHWIVVKGTAEITNGEKVLTLTENQSTYIPLGEVHRLKNPGAIPLEIIEVQSGSYLGEDDIVRFEDHYGRQ